MAARFHVSGGGNWNATSEWSTTTGGAAGASVPGSADTATLDASSGGGTLTLDISPTIQTINLSAYTGTLAFGSNTLTLNSTGSVWTGGTGHSVSGTPNVILTNSSATSKSIVAGSVTEANAVNFEVQAGTGTLGASGNLRNLVFSGTFTGSLSTSTRTIYGRLTLKSGMTVAAGANITAFAATSGIHPLTSAGLTVDFPVTFNGAGGTWELQDNWTLGSTRALTVTAGTVDLNTFQFSAASLTATGTTARGISDGTIVLVGSGATILGAADLTNMAIGGTVSISATYSGGTGTRTLNWGSATGGTEARAVNLNITAGTDTLAISGHYRTLNFTGFSGTLSNNARTLYGGLTVSTGMTLTAGANATTLAATSGSHTITSNGKTLDFPLTVNAPGATYTCADALTLGSTRAFTLTAGTFRLKAGTTNTLQGIALNGGHLRSDTPGSAATVSATSGTKRFYNTIITDITFTGGAEFIALASDGNVDGGGNSGIDFGAAAGGGMMAGYGPAYGY